MFDLSIPVEFGRPRAWYLDGPRREAVRLGEWVGDVNQGGSVNFFDVHFNPHAHGTHTESVGHVVRESVHAVHLPLSPWMRARVLRIPSPGLLRCDWRTRGQMPRRETGSPMMNCWQTASPCCW